MKGKAENIPPARKTAWNSPLVLAAVTLSVYAVSLFNGFVLDDEVIIVGNSLTMGITIPDVGLLSRLARNYHIIPQYIALLIFPADLTVCHNVPGGGLFRPLWFFPVWVVLLATIWLIIQSRNKAALFGLAWCGINYLPISNIVPIPSEPMTERFLYLPAVGFFVIAGAGFARLNAHARIKRLTWGAVVVIIMVLAAVTVWRNLDWRDEYSLFASAVGKNPASSEAHYNLGTALWEKGDLSAARQEWEMALKLNPGNSDALIQMGTFEAMQGNLKRAEQYYIAALNSPGGRADPEKSMAHYNLGKIYESGRGQSSPCSIMSCF